MRNVARVNVDAGGASERRQRSLHQPMNRKLAEMLPIKLAVALREADLPEFHEAGRDEPREFFSVVFMRWILPGRSEGFATFQLGFERAEFAKELLHVAVLPNAVSRRSVLGSNISLVLDAIAEMCEHGPSA